MKFLRIFDIFHSRIITFILFASVIERSNGHEVSISSVKVTVTLMEYCPATSVQVVTFFLEILTPSTKDLGPLGVSYFASIGCIRPRLKVITLPKRINVKKDFDQEGFPTLEMNMQTN